jgi:hypothetical protein
MYFVRLCSAISHSKDRTEDWGVWTTNWCGQYFDLGEEATQGLRELRNTPKQTTGRCSITLHNEEFHNLHSYAASVLRLALYSTNKSANLIITRTFIHVYLRHNY